MSSSRLFIFIINIINIINQVRALPRAARGGGGGLRGAGDHPPAAGRRRAGRGEGGPLHSLSRWRRAGSAVVGREVGREVGGGPVHAGVINHYKH